MNKRYCQFKTDKPKIRDQIVDWLCIGITAGVILLVLYLLLHTTWGVFLP